MAREYRKLRLQKFTILCLPRHRKYLSDPGKNRIPHGCNIPTNTNSFDRQATIHS